MSKSETMPTDTGKAGEPAALTDKDLEAVNGGQLYNGPRNLHHHGAHGHHQGGQNDPAQMFQQIMQQLTQGG